MSTVAGDSGRTYIFGEVLQKHSSEAKYDVYKARWNDDSFVVKQVPQQFFDRSLTLASDLPKYRHLRMHVDYNRNERILIYPYFESTLLKLVQENPELSHIERKKILHRTAEALQAMHSNNWLHLDIKPDNVLYNSVLKPESGSRVVTDAVLGDFDISYHLEPDRSIESPSPVGNVMWRSPEGQTGKGMTKASDIFSFGLTTLYAMGAGELLVLENYSDVLRFGYSAEDEILSRHFTYFGPTPDALYTRVGDEKSCAWIKSIADLADRVVARQPGRRYSEWGPDGGPVAFDLISRMTNLDPNKRPTIDEVLAHAWWEKDEWEGPVEPVF